MFIRKTGDAQLEYFPKKSSTAFIKYGLVESDTAGAVRPASATSINLFGIIQKDVVLSDSDYAANTQVAIDMVTGADLVTADVTTGTATTVMIGTSVDLNATGDGINVTSTANKQFLIKEIISGTKVTGFVLKLALTA